MTDRILDMIDGVLDDYTSADAMRWSPDPEATPIPPSCSVCGGPLKAEQIDVTPAAGPRTYIDGRWVCPHGCPPRLRPGGVITAHLTPVFQSMRLAFEAWQVGVLRALEVLLRDVLDTFEPRQWSHAADRTVSARRAAGTRRTKRNARRTP